MIKDIFNAYINVFKNIFVLRKRLSKYDYWAFIMVNSLVLLIGLKMIYMYPTYACMMTFLLYYIVSVIAQLTAMIRRYHDVEVKGGKFKALMKYSALISLGILLLLFLIFGEAILCAWIRIFIMIFICVFPFCFVILLLRQGGENENKYGPAFPRDIKKNFAANLFVVLNIIIGIITSSVATEFDEKYTKLHTLNTSKIIQSTSNAQATSGVQATSNAQVRLNTQATSGAQATSNAQVRLNTQATSGAQATSNIQVRQNTANSQNAQNMPTQGHINNVHIPGHGGNM